MNQMKLKSDVRIEDLPHGFWQECAETYGIDSVLGLAQIYGGATLYVPSYSSILKESQNRAIREGKVDSHLPKKQIDRICRN